MQPNPIRIDPHSKHFPRGDDLLHDPLLNKGTAFTEEERDALGLRGLLPPHVSTMQEQMRRVVENFERSCDDLQKYVFLSSLQDRNETLFYRLLVDRIEQMMPVVYTPTVGRACQEFGHIYRRARGLYISLRDRGKMRQVLRNWPIRDVRAIVVTDGERILGLGDLGAAGMGIPIGKMSLYSACAGIHPGYCLPITLDVGTENPTFLDDPLYLGLARHRVRGDEYDAFLDEFVEAVREVYPRALLQFEDFASANAFRLLRRYRDRLCTFNDDIQGTAAVALAGLLVAQESTGRPLQDHLFVFAGAGEAGTGIGELLVTALQDAGLSEADARRRCWYVDSKGLIVKSRGTLVEHKAAFAHDHEPAPDLLASIRALEPTALLGASGQRGIFTEPIVREMAGLNERPIVFALSNPTSKSECRAEDAYRWSEGRVIFASGSPFDPVTIGSHRFIPSQGNNAYVFPGLALGVIASGAARVVDEMFLVAARTLAHEVTTSERADGRVYPELSSVREVSAVIATAVARVAWEKGLATEELPVDPAAYIRSCMFDPAYEPYV